MPLEIKAGVQLPGEALLVEMFRFASVYRESMSKENRDAEDAQRIRFTGTLLTIWEKMLKIGTEG